MKLKDIDMLKQIAGYEDNTPEKEWSLGWSWRDVRAYPATLNRLVVEGLLETVFKSNSYTGYRLSERAKVMLTDGGPSTMEEQAPGPVEIPADVFEDILGHQEVKELLLAAMQAPRPVHVLLERAAGSRALWVLASSSSKAGLQERLLEERPSLLLIDELDKMDGRDLSALMSLMEGGRVSRTKVGRMADETLDCRVVAASNTLRLPSELLSRFAIRRLHPYTTEEFREVVGLL